MASVTSESSAPAAVFATFLILFCTAAGAWTRLASARTLIAEGLASFGPLLTLYFSSCCLLLLTDVLIA